jgi:hypothetical protein
MKTEVDVENKAMVPETLVYFGAGWDMSALGKKDFKRFGRHLYIDALPKIPHYEENQAGYAKGKDLVSFMHAIATSIKKYKWDGVFNQSGNQWIFKLRDGRYVEYWINTTVEDALNDSYLRGEIWNAKWLHNKGFFPFEYGLTVDHIPNTFKTLANLRAQNELLKLNLH